MLNEQVEIQEIMNKVFEARKMKNSSYSLRAFARDLDMNSGPLSLILKGRRRISETFAEKLSQKMNLDDKDDHHFKAPFRRKKALSMKHGLRYERGEDVYKINSIEHFYVFTTMKLAKIEPSFSGLKSFLKMPEKKLRKILDDFIEYEMIKEEKLPNGDSHFERMKEDLRIPHEANSNVLRRLEHQTLDVLRNRCVEEETIFQTTYIPGVMVSRERAMAIMQKCTKEMVATAHDDKESDRVYMFGTFMLEV